MYCYIIHKDLHVTRLQPGKYSISDLQKTDIGPLENEEQLRRFTKDFNKAQLETIYQNLHGKPVKFNNRLTAWKRIMPAMEVMDGDTTRPAAPAPVPAKIAPTAPAPTEQGYGEPTPAPEQESPIAKTTKQKAVYDMLCSADGASLNEVVEVMGWLPHTARSAITAGIPKRFACKVERTTEEGRGSVYRVVKAA